jgi:hypothetical protein
MKKFTLIALGVMLATTGFSNTALAATAYGDSVPSFSQGLQKGGAAVAANRSITSSVLGAPDASFFSLGFEGEIVVKFSQLLGGTLSVAVSETTNGTYPEETADVYVSEDGSSWTLAGVATNDGGNQQNSVIELQGDVCVQYVKVIDTTDANLHGNTADGFDVDAVAAEYTGECQRQEEERQQRIKVTNNNGAEVNNDVYVGASTGGNDANGGNGGSAGNGGSVNNSDDDNRGGNGGNSGNGGAGGAIYTGDAVATGNVANMVNFNTTRINGCNCGANLIKVRNNNGALVNNSLRVKAKTGYNDANGGNVGGEGGAGNGGSVNNSDDDNQGGNGGNTGNGGAGGWIQTGIADSLGSIVNNVNRNRTRIGGGN